MSENKPSLWRRALRLGKWVFFVLLLLAIITYLFRGPLLGRPLGRLVASQLSAGLGGEFELDRVGGTWFTGIELVGLRTKTSPEEGALQRVAFDRVAVEYSLLDFFGDRPLDAVSSIRVKDLDLLVDLEAPSPPSEEPPPTPREIADLLPSSLPAIDITGRIAVKSNGGPFRIGRLNIEGGQNRVVVDLAELALPQSLVNESEVPDRLRLELDRPTAERLVLTTPKEFLGIHLRKLETAVTDDDDLDVTADVTFAGGIITAEMKKKTVTARIDGLRTDAFPAWLDAKIPTTPFRPDRATIGATASIADWTVESPETTFELDVTDVRFDDHGAEFHLGGRQFGERLEVSSVRGTFRDANFAIDRAEIDLAADAGLPLRRVEKVVVNVPDVEALLDMFDIEGLPARRTREPIRLDVQLDGAERRIDLTRFEIVAKEMTARITGDIELPAELLAAIDDGNDDNGVEAAWKSIVVDVGLDARVPDLAALPAELTEELREELTEAAAADGSDFGGAVEVSGQARGTFGNPTADLEVTGTDLVARGIRFGRLTSEVRLENKRLDLQALKLRDGPIAFDLTGQVDLDARTLADGRLDLVVADLGQLGDVWKESPDVAGRLEVKGTIEKSAGDGLVGATGDLRIEGRGLRAAGRDVGRADLDVRLDWPKVEATKVSVVGAAANLQATATVDFTDEALPAVDARDLVLRILDLGAVADLLGDLVTDLPILAGSLDVTGEARKAAGAPWTELESTLRVDARAIDVDGTRFDTVDLRFRSQSRDFELETLEARGPWGDARTQGRVRFDPDGAGQATLPRLDAQVNGHIVKLTSPLRASWTTDGAVRAEPFAAQVFGGEVRGEGTVGEHMDVRLSGKAIDLSALPKDLEVGGRLDFDLTATGTRAAPLFEANVRAPNLTWRDIDVDVMLAARQDDTSIDISSLAIRSGDAVELTAKGRLPVRVGESGITTLSVKSADLTLDGVLRDVAFLHRFGVPEEVAFDRIVVDGGMRQGRLEIDTRIEKPAWRDDRIPVEPPSAIRIVTRMDETKTTAELTAEGTPAFELLARAKVDMGLDDDWSTLQSRMMSAPLDTKVDVRVPDVDKFRSLVPGIVRLGGAAHVDVTVNGTLEAPRPTGMVRIDNLAFRSEGDLPSLTDGTMRLRLDDRLVVVETLDGQLGYSLFTITGQVELPSGDAPAKLDIKVGGKDTLVARNQHLRARADLDIAVTGPLDKILVKGRRAHHRCAVLEADQPHRERRSVRRRPFPTVLVSRRAVVDHAIRSRHRRRSNRPHREQPYRRRRLSRLASRRHRRRASSGRSCVLHRHEGRAAVQ